jgi:hypothetical protein
MGTLVQSPARSARGGVVQGLVFALIAALFACGACCGCGGAPSPRAASRQARSFEASACVGGLCVHPDHVTATRMGSGRNPRCLVVAWDGADDLPPTARVGVTDGAPARPGVFAVVDLPVFEPFSWFAITKDPSTTRSGASVYAARVDPGVRFADHRVAADGSVRVEPAGDGALVTVTTTWEGREQIASFTVPRTSNGCVEQGGYR